MGTPGNLTLILKWALAVSNHLCCLTKFLGWSHWILNHDDRWCDIITNILPSKYALNLRPWVEMDINGSVNVTNFSYCTNINTTTRVTLYHWLLLKHHVNVSFQCFIPFHSLNAMTDHIWGLALQSNWWQTYFSIITAINDVNSDCMQIKHYVDMTLDKQWIMYNCLDCTYLYKAYITLHYHDVYINITWQYDMTIFTAQFS